MLNLIFWSCFAWLLSATGDNGTVVTVRAKHNSFTADVLGNMYLVREGELVKYSPQGKRLARYSDLRLGDISFVDASNPMKLLVYYRDFQHIVFLDNQLSVNGKVELQDMGLEQTHLVCSGTNSSYWIYSKQNNDLMRFDEGSKKIMSTGNLKQVLDVHATPEFIVEYNNYLYLGCPGKGIYVFDIYGSFSRFIPIDTKVPFTLNKNLIHYQQGNAICGYDQVTLETGCDSLAASGTFTAILMGGVLYRSFPDSVVARR